MTDVLNLPEPNYIERDREKELREMKAEIEKLIGREIQEFEMDYMNLQVVAHRFYLHKCQIQAAAKQNLIDFATWPMLDFLNGLKGVKRLPGETDSAFRKRGQAAPAAWSTCGPEDAYRFHALSVDSRVVDVAFDSPNDSGKLYIYPLTEKEWTRSFYKEEEDKYNAGNGTQTEDGKFLYEEMKTILEGIEQACNSKSIRPLTETVIVEYPDVLEYSLKLHVYLFPDTPPAIAKALKLIEESANTFVAEKARTFQNITKTQIKQAVKIDGIQVYEIDIVSPIDNVILAASQFAKCTEIVVTHEVKN